MTHIENCHKPTDRPYTAFTACGIAVRTNKIVALRPSCEICEAVLLDFLADLCKAQKARPNKFIRRKKRTL